MAVVLNQRLPYSESVITQGKKYVIRTDVVFTNAPENAKLQSWVPSCIVQ
jgi:hypothetical protein